MDPSSSNQPAPSQIRSRVTVVCGECKRLKLKCDRRNPCGSCTKRDTVARCIYSQAATEKLDVQSVHNRTITNANNHASLIHALTTIFPNLPAIILANGGVPPPSTADGAFPASTSHHRHHHHYAAPHSPAHDALSLDYADLAAIWLHPLDLPESPHSTIKQESRDLLPDPDIPDITTAAKQLLPAMGIYFPVHPIMPPGQSPSSSAAFPHHPSAESAEFNFPPTYAKPQITKAVLDLLPPLEACRGLLNSAAHVFRVRPLPFEPGLAGNGWKTFERRCLALLGGETAEKERRAKREKARKAREIYYASASDDAGSANPTGQQLDKHSLPFFAIVCGVLAIGAHVSTPAGGGGGSGIGNAQHSPAFLYALSQQALGVWETHLSSAGSTTGPHASSATAAEESENMEYVFACLVGVVYSLISGAVGVAATPSNAGVGMGLGLGGSGQEEEESIREKESRAVYTLVSKMVTMARGVGLAKENTWSKKSKEKRAAAAAAAANANANLNPRSTSPGGTLAAKVQLRREKETERERMREEWKRMVWWEVLFYDLFLADVLGHQPLIPAYSYTTKLPACAQTVRSVAFASASHSSSLLAEDELEGEEEGEEEEGGYDHHLGDEGAYEERGAGAKRARGGFGGGSKVHTANPTNPNPTNTSAGAGAGTGADEGYLGARYCLAQLAQTIKNRIGHPDCCCGYTLDQAAALESEIRSWQMGLAGSLTATTATVKDRAGRDRAGSGVGHGKDDGALLGSSGLLGASASAGVGGDLDLGFSTTTTATTAIPATPAGTTPTTPTPTPTTTMTPAAAASHAQSYELALMANLLIVKVYVPFLRAAGASNGHGNGSGNGSGNGNGNGHASGHLPSVAAPGPSAHGHGHGHGNGNERGHAGGGGGAHAHMHMHMPAAQATVQASRSILRIANVLAELSSSSTSTLGTPTTTLTSSTTPTLSSTLNTTPTTTTPTPIRPILPMLLDLYPLPKLTFDALVICAHACLAGRAQGLVYAFEGGTLGEEVVGGVGLVGRLEGESSVNAKAKVVGGARGARRERARREEEARRRVCEALRRRVVQRGNQRGVPSAGPGMGIGMGMGVGMGVGLFGAPPTTMAMATMAGGGTKRKRDQVDEEGSFGPSTEFTPTNHGAAGASGGEGMMPGFDYANHSHSHLHHQSQSQSQSHSHGHSHGHGQYLHNGIPVAQQQLGGVGGGGGGGGGDLSLSGFSGLDLHQQQHQQHQHQQQHQQMEMHHDGRRSSQERAANQLSTSPFFEPSASPERERERDGESNNNGSGNGNGNGRSDRHRTSSSSASSRGGKSSEKEKHAEGASKTGPPIVGIRIRARNPRNTLITGGVGGGGGSVASGSSVGSASGSAGASQNQSQNQNQNQNQTIMPAPTGPPPLMTSTPRALPGHYGPRTLLFL